MAEKITKEAYSSNFAEFIKDIEKIQQRYPELLKKGQRMFQIRCDSNIQIAVSDEMPKEVKLLFDAVIEKHLKEKDNFIIIQ